MGLKISQHTRKNKQGPVMHQIVRSASGLIGGIHFEMTRDTATTSMLSLIKDQLITMLGGNLDTIDGLEGSEFFTDRGYKESVNAIIKAGADINGTDAKTFSCPFVYGQKLRPNDSIEEIDVYGGKTLMIKKTSMYDRSVFVHFYRNGNGGAVIGRTTLFRDFEWEFVIKNMKDLEWYDLYADAFYSYLGSIDDDDDEYDEKVETLNNASMIITKISFKPVYQDIDISDDFIEALINCNLFPFNN